MLEYLIDLNATQAAIRAGYSEKTAAEQASRLLTNVKIAAAIAEAQAKRSQRTGITQDRVLAELAKIGFFDLRKTFTQGGALIDPLSWDDETAGAIAALEVVSRPGELDDEGNRTVEHVHKIKAWDKLAALEKLGKHLGMFGGEGADKDDAPGLTINFKTAAPVKEIRVTRSDT